MFEKVKALLSTAVTYMVIASSVLSIFSEEIGQQFAGSETAERVVQGIVAALGMLTAAILIVRRVVTVIPEQRQLEPLPAGTTVEPVAGTTK